MLTSTMPTQVVTSSSLRCITPVKSDKRLRLSLLQDGVSVAEYANAHFSRHTPLQVVAVRPLVGALTGGDTVTVIGESFDSNFAITCLFGDALAVSALVVSSSSLTCKTPLVDFVGPRTLELSANGRDYTSDGKIFSFFDGTSVRGVFPTLSRSRGGSRVRIVGTFFSAGQAPECLFGSTRVAGVLTSLSSITCRTPRMQNGLVPVSVSISELSSDASHHIMFVDDLQIYSVVPSIGTVGVESRVTITGEGFLDLVTGCNFGGWRTRQGSVASVSHIVCVTPAVISAGPVDVFLSDMIPDGDQSPSNALRFEFVSVPTVFAVSPSKSLGHGGEVVVLRGQGFLSTSHCVCRFGKAVVSVFRHSSTEQVACISPSFSLGGNFSVSVSNDGGSSYSNELPYEVSVLSVTHAFPSMGPRFGGSVITIFGTGFCTLGNPKCLFGTFSVDAAARSDTEIHCVSPAAKRTDLANFNISVTDGTSPGSRSTAVFEFFDDFIIRSVAPSRALVSGSVMVHMHFSAGTDRLVPDCIFGDSAVPASLVMTGVLSCLVPPLLSPGLLQLGLAWGGPVAPSTVPFLLDAEPLLVSLEPSTGPTSGSIVVLIALRGVTDMGSAPLCRFGNVEVAGEWRNASALSGVVIHDAVVQCVAPSHRLGIAIVEVAANGADFLPSALEFLFWGSVPSFSFKPSHGPASGGTVIQLDGVDAATAARATHCVFGLHITPLSVSGDATSCMVPPAGEARNFEVSLRDDGSSRVAVALHRFERYPPPSAQRVVTEFRASHRFRNHHTRP